MFQIVATVGGLIIVGYRWPMPDTLSRIPVNTPNLWSLTLMVAANAVWLSGAAAAGFSRIDNSRARMRVLQVFATVLLVAGSLYWAPAYPVIRVIAPAAFGWVPLLTGLILLAVSWERRLWHTGPSGRSAVVFHDKPSLVGRYEEQIRQAARQEERARLARDLHDAVKQQLFVIQTAAATVESRFDTDPGGAQEALTRVRTSAREALTEMEVMLEQLQARPIGMAGLIESLKRQCEVLRFRTDAEVHFEANNPPGDAAMPPGAHQAMLRFAQEALANVARHARAHRVDVTLAGSPGAVSLTVTDDGQGFDASKPPSGIGLTSMSARAAEVDGHLEVESSPERGTTVRFVVPLAKEDVSTLKYKAIAAGAFLVVCPFLVPFFDLINPGLRFAFYILAALSAASLIRYGSAWWRMRS